MLGKKKLGTVLVSLALLSYMTTTLVSSRSHRRADSGSEEVESARSPAVASLRRYSDDGRLDISNCMHMFDLCTIYSTCIRFRLLKKPSCTCPDPCTSGFDLICGSDGRTYLNHCDLMYKSCEKRRNTTQLYYGRCLPEDYMEEPIEPDLTEV